MLKDRMWNIFKTSGNINAFLYYKDVLKIELKKRNTQKMKIIYLQEK